MNELSNGPPPRRALHAQRGLAAALFGGFAVTMAACPGPTPRTDTDGSGGEGSATSSTSTTSSASSSSGGMQCTTPADCPPPPSNCATALCESAMCDTAPAAAKTPCSDNGGTLCDGAGHCVECVTDAECPSGAPNPCNDSGVYTGPTTCKSGVCEAGKVKDCAASGRICKPAGCMDCATNVDCAPLTGPCISRTCKGGVCEKEPLTQGTTCLGPISGTCDAMGTCAPRKYVFVTSTIFLPNFGSAKLADDTCASVAGSAALGGTWKSWTSDSASTPWDRFTSSAAPYMLLDDVTIVALKWGDLIDGTLKHGIDLDEHKQPVPQSSKVWTGTNEGGNYAGAACTNWSFVSNGASLQGTVGLAGDTTSAWTAKTPLACNVEARLYCFQQ